MRKSNGTLAVNGTLYWYMTPGIVAESDLAGTTTSEYVFFGGERVARRDGVNGAGGVRYYFSDRLKTAASVITDATTTPTISVEYAFSSKASPSAGGNITVTDTITTDTVNLQQTTEMPKWDGRDSASPEEQQTWDSHTSDLMQHENTHADQNRQSADALDKSLPGTKASASGKTTDKKNPPAQAAKQKLSGAVQDKIDNTVNEMTQKGHELDDKTHHGTVKEHQ